MTLSEHAFFTGFLHGVEVAECITLRAFIQARDGERSVVILKRIEDDLALEIAGRMEDVA